MTEGFDRQAMKEWGNLCGGLVGPCKGSGFFPVAELLR